MNKSYDAGQSSHYLPPISRNESASIHKTHRSQSHHEIAPIGSLNTTPLTRKLIETDSLRNPDEYNDMNEKELLREHEHLLKILKKYQELIDINLVRKQKEREKEAIFKAKNGDKRATKEEIMSGEISNNKKIIQNYLREIKDLESAKNHRKLQDVLQEKAEVMDAIAKIKKQIFEIKNKDTMASRGLMTNRGSIEKQLHDAEKDLKTQLTRNADYKKKIDDLTQHLTKLKADCSSINVSELTAHSQQKDYVMILAEKRMELEEAQKACSRTEESIQEVMVNKTKRNKGIAKEIEGMEKRITELNSRIQSYKDKVARYQKVIDPQGPQKAGSGTTVPINTTATTKTMI